MITYNVTLPKEITVMVDADPTMTSQTIAAMVSESGGEAIAVKQKDGSSTYEVTVSTNSGKSKFLEQFRKRLGIQKASIKE
jgi:hypothetical protein